MTPVAGKSFRNSHGYSETGIGGGQNVPNARGGGGNSPRKLSLESLDF